MEEFAIMNEERFRELHEKVKGETATQAEINEYIQMLISIEPNNVIVTAGILVGATVGFDKALKIIAGMQHEERYECRRCLRKARLEILKNKLETLNKILDDNLCNHTDSQNQQYGKD